MRKVTFGVANSLDNYIARKNHAFDWIRWGPEAAAVMSAYWKTIDTLVMGRKTYAVARKNGSSYPGMKTYVFSRTLKRSPDKNVQIIAENPGKFIRKLKAQKGKDICVMGGGQLANALLQAGVIDEIGFCIHPLLLGSGIPLFLPMKRQVNLELLKCKPFKNGCVYVMYQVKPFSTKKKGGNKGRS